MHPRQIDKSTALTVFLVGPTKSGRWLVQETRGLVEGMFFAQRDALKFAMAEAKARKNAVVISASELTATDGRLLFKRAA